METTEKYDSSRDTADHIQLVQHIMELFCNRIRNRAMYHDASKRNSPEKEALDLNGQKLRSLTYGSEEYFAQLKSPEMAAFLDHHYKTNSHHPEHFENGVAGMDLFDFIEMFADWRAAVERHKDGDIMVSIEKNTKRFNLDPQIVSIFQNTAKILGWATVKETKVDQPVSETRLDEIPDSPPKAE